MADEVLRQQGKSLLRAAAGDLLPEPVANRKKSAYPITHDPGYDAALRAEFARLAGSPGTPVHALIDGGATARLGSANGWPARSGLEFMVQLDSWLADHDLAL